MTGRELLGLPREQLLDMLFSHGIGESGPTHAARAALAAKLTDDVGEKVVRLADVISASANQGARGAKWVAESVDKFRDATATSTETLKQSLDAFRESMDLSSKKIARLTAWLVVATVALALTAVIQVALISWRP